MWGLLRAGDLTLNLSGSMPVGVYRRTQEPLGVGQIVAVCLPAEIARVGRTRGYLHAGPCPSGTQAVLKFIAAMAGDVVEVEPAGVTINARPIPQSAVRAVDSAGRAMPHCAWGTVTLAPGELWLLSTQDARSWDSRYYGPVPSEAVLTTARPVWVLP
jgi:conjugative transfer signal peptidase TraF